MDPIALGFIALAAVLHAAWNILLKAADDPLRTAAVGVAAASVVLMPIVVIGWLTLGQPAIPTQAWALGITSGGVEVLYFAFLAAAFRRGDLSVVYPLARGSAPLLAIAIGVVILGERLAPGAWLGVGLLLAGLLLVQRPWRLLRSASSANDRAAAGFALLTGATIAVYSALDRVGVQQTPVWVYAGILWPTCAIGLAVLVFARRRVAGGRYAVTEAPIDRRTAVAGGFLTFSAYALVLGALSRAPLAIVAPLRESAVVLTSLWGVFRLREVTGRREISIRIAGSVLVLLVPRCSRSRADATIGAMQPTTPTAKPALKLGYKASAEQFHPRRLLDLAIIAEDAGFESVWTSDHFQPWRHTGGHAPNALVWLGAAAASTKHVTIGTSVLTPSFRYNPAVVAQAFATLSCLAEGRIILGVGTGESMNEVPVGVDWPDQSERFARLREAITLIKQLWAEEFVNFEGEYFTTHDATVYDRPTIPVPIYVAASGPAAARLAGRIGDGFICTSGKGEELYTQTLLPSLAEGAEKAGRDVTGMERMIEMKVSFDPDFDQAMEDTKVWAALALPGDKKMGVHDPREMEILAKEAEPYAHKRWLVSSDPDEHVEQIAPYIAWGFNHLVFHFPGDAQEEAIRRYAETILPRLRARFG